MTGERERRTTLLPATAAWLLRWPPQQAVPAIQIVVTVRFVVHTPGRPRRNRGRLTVSAYIHRQLVDLLEEKRVVVWYDDSSTLRELALRFKAPQYRLVDASDSILLARREADRVLRSLNDPEAGELRTASLLVYLPHRRGQKDEERYQDPFEALAVCGVTFGDKPTETLQSLARQAMPNRTAEIDRLFQEGRPTLVMLDGLKAGASYPLLKDCLGTDSPLDVASRVLCVRGTAERVAAAQGASEELLRLLQAEYGYTAPARAVKVESKVEPLGPYVLLSEFAFDFGSPLQEALADLPVARASTKRAFSRCATGCGAATIRRALWLAAANRIAAPSIR